MGYFKKVDHVEEIVFVRRGKTRSNQKYYFQLADLLDALVGDFEKGNLKARKD